VTPAATLYLSPRPGSEALRRLLIEEAGPSAIVDDASAADLVAELRVEGAQLMLECRGSDGEVVISRSIAGRIDDAAALRVAVVLLDEALASRPARRAPSTAPAAPARRSLLGISVGPSLGFFSRPLTAELGVRLAADLDLEEVRLLLEGRLLGIGCCSPESLQIRSDLTAVAVTAEADLPILKLGPAQLFGAGGVGVTFDWGTAQSKVFAGPGATQSVSQATFAGRVGVRLELPLGPRLALVAGGGIELFVGRLGIALPGPFASNTETFGGGPACPWADLALRWAPL
jgi:hypothetical protein